MNIETLISVVVKTPISTNSWDIGIFTSLYDQIFIRQQAFTEKQANLALKLLTRYRKQLGQVLNQDISAFLQNPVYKMPIRKHAPVKKIAIAKDPTLSRVFRAEFPYEDTLVSLFRSQRNRNSNYVQWSDKDKCWILALNEKNLKFLMDVKKDYGFEVDTEFQELESHALAVMNSTEHHVPMICWENSKFEFRNTQVEENLDVIKDPISAIFAARKYGITVWDSAIEEHLNNQPLNSLTSKFLKSDPGIPLEIQGTELSDLRDIIQRLSPCLFVIPGGDELAKTRAFVNFLAHLGIASENISVLFRLNSDKNTDFNVFVKEQGLNNPLSDKTQAVFISQRFPKVILQSGIKFGCVICLGTAIVHYLIKDYLQSHKNVIYFYQRTNQGMLNFAKL